MIKRLLPLLAAFGILSCGAQSDIVHYIVTSQSTYLCCRTVRYSTWEFPKTESSSTPGEGVAVRLAEDTIVGRCSEGAEVAITIANNDELDIYIPFSKELEGSSVKLYPWRIFYEDGMAIRLARQLQYNDIVEREDALHRFFRLPSGKQITLRGVVPQRWLCSPTTAVTDEYLGLELNPTFYADRSRGLRGAEYRRDPQLLMSVPFRYEIAYTTLRYLDSLPVISRVTSRAGDTTQVTIAVKEEPAHFLDASQRVARSNRVMLKITD